MGDPRGIGPEVALRALARGPDRGRVRLVGVREVFELTAARLGLLSVYARLAGDLLEVERAVGLDPEPGEPRDELGRPWLTLLSPAVAGRWAGRSIEAAVRELEPARGDLLVTAPIDKAALHAGGYEFPGHTEMLAALAGAPAVAMMLLAGPLRVSLVTTHVPLRLVAEQVGRDRIRQVFLLTRHAVCAGFGVDAPRIAICGLNPHAGERGALGREEIEVIEPEIGALREEGFAVEGPVPGDTAFVRALAGEFDAVLALYHDQGMIPVKLHGFGRGVNVTLGLPFVRTSPDHGTALDIAGTGLARADSFTAALSMAEELAARPDFVRHPVYNRAPVS